MSAGRTAPKQDAGDSSRGAKERGTLLFPALGVLGLLAAWLVVDSFQSLPDAPLVLSEQRPRYRLEEAAWQRYDETGGSVFEAEATSIDYFDDASMLLTNIALDTHADKGHWRLIADRGHVAAGEKRMRLEPDVDVRGEARELKPVEIRTPTLWVDWEARTLSTPDPVNATAPGRQLQALGMRADWAAEKVEFLQNVEVRHAGG